MDSNQCKAVALCCQVSGGSLNEDSGQHPPLKKGSRPDKSPTLTWKACEVTTPTSSVESWEDGLSAHAWVCGLWWSKSLGPASHHENNPERRLRNYPLHIVVASLSLDLSGLRGLWCDYPTLPLWRAEGRDFLLMHADAGGDWDKKKYVRPHLVQPIILFNWQTFIENLLPVTK